MLKDCTILVLLLGVSTTATFVQTARHPEQVFTDQFLFHDAGVNLLLAKELNAGKVLYRDLSYQYGPIPIYLYTAASRLFGNSATTYVEFHRSLSLLHLTLVFLVLRSRFPRWPAAAVTLLGVAPFAIVPGAILGGYLCSAYMPIERCYLTLLPLLWQPPGIRSNGRAAALGAYIGGYQFIKFGGGFFAGAAVFLLDLLVLAIAGFRRDQFGRWLRTSLSTLAAFAVVEGFRCGIAVVLLPAAVAWDVIWPIYIAQNYATLATDLYPWQMSWRHIVLRQLVPILGIAYAVIGMVLAARRGVGAIPKMGVLTLALFYGVALFKYFGHTHVFLQYAWMLMVPTILLYDLAGRRAQIFILVSLLPGWLSLGYLLHHPPTGADCPRYQMPNGDVLFPSGMDDPPLLPRLELLFQQRWGKPHPGPSQRVLIFPMGAGYHFYYRVPRFSRQLWYIPHFVRPYDTAEIIRNLDQAAAVIVRGEPSGDALSWAEPLFAPQVVSLLRERLEPPVQLSPVCRVFFVRPVASP
jgi:hypothetical protein